MTNYTLEFKHKETPSNLLISTCKAILDGKYVVEFWDVNKAYHSLMPLVEFKVGEWNKYNNKRVLVDTMEFNNTFTVIKETTI
jgi:hypothetical protein